MFACGSCDTLKSRHRANEAAGLYKKGDLPSAAAAYTEAEGLDPGIATIHLNLGFTCLSLFNQSPKSTEGQKYGARAVQEFETYLKQKPDDPRGRQYLLQTFVDTKRYDDAVAFFKPEVEETPPSMEAISILGQIAAKLGRFDDAIGWYQKRVDLAPESTDGLIGLGMLLWDYLHNHPEVTGERRIQLADRAIATLKKASELKPFLADPYIDVNLVYRERSNAHVCITTDGGVPLLGATPDMAGMRAPDGGVAIGACEARRNDLLEAEKNYKLGLEKMKAQGGVGAAGGGGGEAKPGAKPGASSSNGGGSGSGSGSGGGTKPVSGPATGTTGAGGAH